MTARVLLVDDERDVREALGQTLELADLEPVVTGSFIEAKDHIGEDFDGVIVTDIRMPGRDGFHLLGHARKLDPDLPVILLTGEGDVPMAVRAMSEGAFDFIEKPCGAEDFLAVVRRALKARSLVMENRRLRLQLERGDAAARIIIGVSQAVEELRARVRAVARARGEVLVTGAVGTGTPKVAEVIHLLGSAGNRTPFVKRAAASLSPEALAAALEEAEGGTFYLDEVTGLPPAAQFALMEYLDGVRGVRVIAGSTRDIEAAATSGGFMADLQVRLDLMRVRVPSLSERPEDIPVLFRHYVAQASEQANLPEPEIGPEVIARLMAQDWPGNARALMNAAMRFVMGLGEETESAEGLGLVAQMARVERSLLVQALTRTGGHAIRAAEALKLPRKTFYDKLARHGLRAEDYRVGD